jgi:threonine/homoserine/homoserine lactone efflux protein
MLEYISLGIMGFVVGLSGAMMPGPLLVYTISQVLEKKKGSAFWIVCGHMCIEAVMIVLILLGLKQLIGSKAVYNTVSLLGAAGLIFMGTTIIIRAKKMNLALGENLDFTSGLVAGGVFFTAFNPTFPLWWVSIGASLLSRALLAGAVGVMALVFGHWLADLGWYSMVVSAVGRGKSWLNERKFRICLKILGVVLLGMGFWFVMQVKK